MRGDTKGQKAKKAFFEAASQRAQPGVKSHVERMLNVWNTYAPVDGFGPMAGFRDRLIYAAELEGIVASRVEDASAYPSSEVEQLRMETEGLLADAMELKLDTDQCIAELESPMRELLEVQESISQLAPRKLQALEEADELVQLQLLCDRRVAENARLRMQLGACSSLFTSLDKAVDRLYRPSS